MRVVDEPEGTRRKPSGLIQIAPTGARWKMVVNLTGKQHGDDDDDDDDDDPAKDRDPDHALGPYLFSSSVLVSAGTLSSSRCNAVSIFCSSRSILSCSSGPGWSSSCSIKCCFRARSFATVVIRSLHNPRCGRQGSR